ncbi:hypothetical protein D3C73_834420 [compost metagenome]
MASAPAENAGDTDPPLRPDAPQAMRRPSSKVTLRPRRASSSAVDKPAKPPPTTQTSVLATPASGG